MSKALSAITKEMSVRDIVALVPGGADIMAEYGLHCFSCSIGGAESLEDGVAMHGWKEETLEMLLADLNDAFEAQPERPQNLSITLEAARAIRVIAEKEEKVGWALTVVLDESGGFCMEFRKVVGEGDLAFTHADEPDVYIAASPLTLRRIGGATVDFRDGRFKLDLENPCCHGKKRQCLCHSTQGKSHSPTVEKSQSQ